MNRNARQLTEEEAQLMLVGLSIIKKREQFQVFPQNHLRRSNNKDDTHYWIESKIKQGWLIRNQISIFLSVLSVPVIKNPRLSQFFELDLKGVISQKKLLLSKVS